MAKQEADRRCWFFALWLCCLPAAISAQTSQTTSAEGLNPAKNFAGKSSCLAGGCHGGPDLLTSGELAPAGLRNAASVWQNHDRHQRAYQVLKSEQSKQILRQLAGTGVLTETVDIANPRPELEQRCLACHTTPTLAVAELNLQSGIAALREEGVSCDACHTRPGASSLNWVDAHARGQLRDCYAIPARGLQPLTTAVQRAAVCVGCHVGAPADRERGIPLRDMNHDLIAAGHPRLFFDYATFLQLLPPHWREREPAGGTVVSVDPTGEVVQAVLGQTVVLRSQLDLLIDRTVRKTPWPELAELDCYRCHHDLRPSDWRQTNTDRDLAGRATWAGLATLGPARRWLPLANERQAAALGQISKSLSLFQTPAAAQLALASNWVDSALAGGLGPDAPRTPEELIPEWPLRQLPSVQSSTAEADQSALRSSSDNPPPYAPLSWDEAARRYYYLKELQRILQPSLVDSGTPADSELQHALSLLFDSLRFPQPAGAVNSPDNYNPQVAAAHYSLARERLIQRWSTALPEATTPRK